MRQEKRIVNRWWRRFRGEALEARCVLAGEPLIISEFMAANVQFLQDRFKEYSDWIEVYNPTDHDVSLDGWALTDDPKLPQEWVFPDVSLPAHGSIVVFASARDRRSATSELHTNFKLATDGEYLALVRPDGSIAHEYEPDYPIQQGDVSYGVVFDDQGPHADRFQYFGKPTPNAANEAGPGEFAGSVSFDVPRGFYAEPITVHLSADLPDGKIRYTTDGSEPTAEHGELYTGKIDIATTTTLRAVSYSDNFLPGKVGTQTYIYLDKVLEQTGNDMGLPTQWGYFDDQGPAKPARGKANYAMDPDIVNNPKYHDQLKDDLLALPTLSIVIDPDDLWNLDTGLYMNPEQKGDAWERPASFELIQPNGETAFQVDAGLQMHGGWARRISQTAKFSFRVAFKGQYGDSLLNYPLFGEEGNESYDEIVLRGGFNDSWAGGDRNNTYMQDQWTRQTQLEMGGLAPRNTYVHLYLNGLYWGMYSPTERPDAVWAANYEGGTPDEYDVINTGGNVIDGNATAWSQLVRAMAPSRYDFDTIASMVDLEGFADYMIVNQYIGNWDWPHNNWYASRHRVEGAKWEFHSWDAEAAFQQGTTVDRVTASGISSAVGPSDLFTALRYTPQFQEIFANRVAKHLYGDGVLTPAANVTRLNNLASQIDEAIVGESARWGDGRTDSVSPSITQTDWANRIKSLNNSYFPRRGDVLVEQFRDSSLFGAIDPPIMLPSQGRFPSATDVNLSSDVGDIYYTTDGSDPRGADGLPSAAARRFNNFDWISPASPLKFRIPTGSASENNWQQASYDDSAWNGGTASVGYDNGQFDDPLVVVGGFNVLDVATSTTLGTLADADALLAGAGQTTKKTVTGVPVINYQQNNGDGHFSNNEAFPIGGNNHALDVTATLHVSAAGPYTFGVTSNDAARLLIDGTIMYEDAERHGAVDKLINVDLTEGDHQVQIIFFQRVGAATLEFYFTSGTKTVFDDTFALVGDFQNRAYSTLITTDVRAALEDKNSSLYARIPFSVTSLSDTEKLELRLRYDDGFVMYLNGTEVARRNAPDALSFNATAATGRRDTLAVVEEAIDLTAFKSLLHPGQNVMAVQVLNASAGATICYSYPNW